MTDQPTHTSSETSAASELTLPELLSIIDEELATCLRAQQDDTLSIKKDTKLKEIGRHICIELAGKQLAIPLSAVLEAGELQQVQRLPLLQDWLTGITNIRGEIVSVVNLALFLNLQDKAFRKAHPFLLVHDDRIKTAVTVDRIIGTRSLYHSSTQESDNPAGTSLQTGFFSGRAIFKEQGEEKEIQLFNLDVFLSSQKLRDVATA